MWHRSFVVDAWEGGQFEQQEQFFVCRIESYDVVDYVMEDEEERCVTTSLLPKILAGDFPPEPMTIDR